MIIQFNSQQTLFCYDIPLFPLLHFTLYMFVHFA